MAVSFKFCDSEPVVHREGKGMDKEHLCGSQTS